MSFSLCAYGFLSVLLCFQLQAVWCLARPPHRRPLMMHGGLADQAYDTDLQSFFRDSLEANAQEDFDNYFSPDDLPEGDENKLEQAAALLSADSYPVKIEGKNSEGGYAGDLDQDYIDLQSLNEQEAFDDYFSPDDLPEGDENNLEQATALLSDISIDSVDYPATNIADEYSAKIEGKYSEQINSGDTVSFKTSLPTKWMSLSKPGTGAPFASQCPRMFMDKKDYSSCKRAVFKLYKLHPKGKGQGVISVGDMVGIYTPLARAWLGCSSRRTEKCGLTGCPRKPTAAYGFARPQLIKRCSGAIFKIFARGKNIGDAITHKDDIMLYINKYSQYVSYKPLSVKRYETTFQAEIMHRGTCPGGRNPPVYKYEQCSNEIFSIWKKET